MLYIFAKISASLLNETEQKIFYIDEFKIVLEIYIEDSLINLKNDILESSSIMVNCHENGKLKIHYLIILNAKILRFLNSKGLRLLSKFSKIFIWTQLL